MKDEGARIASLAAGRDVAPPEGAAPRAPKAGYFSGHMTLRDGTHIPLSSEQAEKLWREAEASRAARALKLPDERAAIDAMFEAYDRLRELGWREAIYCPKDGSQFEVIEPGSTGIFRGYYSGEWPKGSWWTLDDRDTYPGHPILFRLLPEDEARRQERMRAARERFAAERATARKPESA